MQKLVQDGLTPLGTLETRLDQDPWLWIPLVQAEDVIPKVGGLDDLDFGGSYSYMPDSSGIGTARSP